MNKKLKALIRTCTAFACALTICSVNTITYAEDSVNTLEQKTTDLQDKLDTLNQELTTLSTEITDLASKIEDTNASVEKAELDLAAAKLNEEMQYDAMKKRIKYMYESGNTSLLQIIFSSESMGDFLNNTEFVRNVTEYDREMLEELQQIHTDVQAKEQSLKDEQAELQDMKDSLDSQQDSLNAAIASTSGDLKASSEALEKAKAAQAAAQAALEQEAQEKAKNQAASSNKGNQDNSSQNPSSGDNKGQTPGQGGTSNVSPTPVETDDLVLLAALLQCEAGSSDYDALLAVATVVMNRVSSGRYPNSLRGVIYQSGQFSPTWNGSLSRVLANGPASLCYQVAKDALGGARLSSVSGCYSFRAAYTGHAGTVVGGNVFF